MKNYARTKAMNSAILKIVTLCFCATFTIQSVAQEETNNSQASSNEAVSLDKEDNAGDTGIANTPRSQSGAGTGKQPPTIVIEAGPPVPEPQLIFTSSAQSNLVVSEKSATHVVVLKARVLQGKAATLEFGLNGTGVIKKVSGASLLSWSVGEKDSNRFLELRCKEDATSIEVTIEIEDEVKSLPSELSVTHLKPGRSAGFDALIKIDYQRGITGTLAAAEGFAPLQSVDGETRIQTATGGRLTLKLARQGAKPAPVEFTDTSLSGQLHPNGKSVSFRLTGTAQVNEADSKLVMLSGNAALSSMPTSTDYRLRLKAGSGNPVYEAVFDSVGTFSVAIDFVADISTPAVNWQGIDFTVAAGAVVPLTLIGFDSDLEFKKSADTLVPFKNGDLWSGFLPATGRIAVQWKTASATTEGKLFFKTSARIETRVGPGLLRQDHFIDYQVLQGQLKSLELAINGPGEILGVENDNVLGWKVVDAEGNRTLNITLRQPITSTSQLRIRSQTALGAFPVRVEGMALDPVGVIRHSGYIRILNAGSVSIEPTALSGLTQLAPEQFPAEKIQARQMFVYRFPSSNHSFTIVADRIQPEVNVSELVVYRLSETEKVITADVELDIREAPIREWDLSVPEDYSIVSVAGASIADYVVSTDAENGLRNLRLIFASEVAGRQLASILMEKSEAAAAGDWILPKIDYPGAKSVRGDIGVVGAPGFRIASGETNLLAEKPLSYFPKPVPNLQQAYRARDRQWTATVQIELLERSVQSDVFHLYSLSQGAVYGSALINYFVTGAPATEWQIDVPEKLGNVVVDGQDIRTWRREGDTLIVSLHQPVMGPYTLLITFEEKPDEVDGSFEPGIVTPQNVQGDRGYIQVVSPMQVEIEQLAASSELLVLDALELPAEFRLLSTAPALGTWQYTERPFNLKLKVNWFEPGSTATQIVEFSEANSRVSADGELVTDLLYYVKARGQRTLRLQLPGDPVKLWEVMVNGEPVTARQADDATLIPLPGGADPNMPIEVSLRLGKPSVPGEDPVLTLPTVFAPVLKTQWNVGGEENHVLLPSGGTVTPSTPVLRPTGFDWLARSGLPYLVPISLLSILGVFLAQRSSFLKLAGIAVLVIAAIFTFRAASDSLDHTGTPAALQLSLPVLSTGETVTMQVRNLPSWQASISWIGTAGIAIGISLLIASFVQRVVAIKQLLRLVSVALIGTGCLLQRDGAPLFLGLLGVGLVLLLLVPACIASYTTIKEWRAQAMQKRKSKEDNNKAESSGGDASAVATTVLAFLAASSTFFGTNAHAQEITLLPADSLTQQWDASYDDKRLNAECKITLTGRPGDSFQILQAPAILTRFVGDGLRLSKRSIGKQGMNYIVTIPLENTEASSNNEGLEDEDSDAADDSSLETASTTDDDAVKQYEATFEYRLEAISPSQGIPVYTGSAAVQEIDLTFSEAGWDVICSTSVRIEPEENDDTSKAKILLGPGRAAITLKPRARDLTTEETQFFIEGQNLYSANPGVVDGIHRIDVRTSQGKVQVLSVLVPEGLTVSAVGEGVDNWQFDAEKRLLHLEMSPSLGANFSVLIETQRGLDSLPAEVELAPLRVQDCDGEVGLLAVAFGPDAQPASVEAEGMSMVNLGDFDPALVKLKQNVIHRVFRYGSEEGSLSVSVAQVTPEIRLISRQVLSLGDERVVLGVNFVAEITRAGLFQLSFTLPDGFEVESLTGAALHHWTELEEADSRQIILHLNGKTQGAQNFALTLTGAAPTEEGDWTVPRFEINEAARQTGELVVRPITGIRLRTVTRQNVSEADPRTMGGQGQGALAFRLLQRDWSLVLGIEKLAPWVTGNVLHDVTIREGQTRTVVAADFNVQNASIRQLEVELPISNADEIKTLRATGKTVSDFVRSAPDSNVWTIQFKRRVIGRIQLQIEYERRGDRASYNESLEPLGFPTLRQVAYYFSVRAGGRLEIEPGQLTQGWQRTDWNTVPQALREAGNRNTPAITLRAVAPGTALSLTATRHSLAEALKLRVAEGTLTTVLSPTGDQLTAVEVTMEVIQRSSLTVQLPDGGDLFSIFVNGESVHSIRQSDNPNVWQFYILPVLDDRTAKVRFVYSLTGDSIAKIGLESPQLNVPLENVKWNVLAPKGFRLTDNDGNLELIGEDLFERYDRRSYLSKVTGKRQDQAQKAAQLLEQANQLLQAGQQTKARWALNSVANQYALDAASNEDARVQLENLQTQQAIVGLNTRRQRLYLYNNRSDASVADNEQMRQAAAVNPILQDDQLNFRPQELSQLLGGNTTEDNAVLQQIAGRLVQHQRSTEPAPQAIIISVPEEGTVYSFSRSVQVAENSPLELDLSFASEYSLAIWQWAIVGILGLLLAYCLSRTQVRTPAAE